MLAALSGCDYVLGLDRRSDAGALDGASDAPLPADAQYCFADNFQGIELDVVAWESAMATGLSVSTNANLIFRFLTTAAPSASAYIRSRDVFDLRASYVEALIDQRPSGQLETALVVASSAGAPLYEMRILPNGQLRCLVAGSVLPAIPLAGNFLRIRFTSDQVIFGSGNNGAVYVETMASAMTAVNNVKLAITATATGTPASQTDVTWDHIRVSCP